MYMGFTKLLRLIIYLLDRLENELWGSSRTDQKIRRELLESVIRGL
jgi:hypothetical protein